MCNAVEKQEQINTHISSLFDWKNINVLQTYKIYD